MTVSLEETRLYNLKVAQKRLKTAFSIVIIMYFLGCCTHYNLLFDLWFTQNYSLNKYVFNLFYSVIYCCFEIYCLENTEQKSFAARHQQSFTHTNALMAVPIVIV